jgi:hypothetical protein
VPYRQLQQRTANADGTPSEQLTSLAQSVQRKVYANVILEGSPDLDAGLGTTPCVKKKATGLNAPKDASETFFNMLSISLGQDGSVLVQSLRD